MQFLLKLAFDCNLETGIAPSMNKCELDLEEDALIILEQLELQGTLYFLKRQTVFIRRLGKDLQNKSQGNDSKISECRVESRRYISIQNILRNIFSKEIITGDGHYYRINPKEQSEMRAANLQQAQQTNHSVTSTLPHTQPRAHQITRILLIVFGPTK
jgi:hypothetical protein